MLKKYIYLIFNQVKNVFYSIYEHFTSYDEGKFNLLRTPSTHRYYVKFLKVEFVLIVSIT